VNQIEALIQDGLTDGEIASKVGRSEAGIKNLRYRKNLVKKAKHETKVLFKRRVNLKAEIEDLCEQKNSFIRELEQLRKEKQKLDITISIDKILLQNALIQALTNLKLQRGARATLSKQDQIVVLTKFFFDNLLR
jgi:hypothetical protein